MAFLVEILTVLKSLVRFVNFNFVDRVTSFKTGKSELYYSPLFQRIHKYLLNISLWSIFIAKVSGNIPGCDYFDTVDLTNSHPIDNGSYLYDGILIPKEKVGNFTKQIFFDGEEQYVPEHIRGCVCQDKPCIRFCCEPHLELVDKERTCRNIHNGIRYVNSINITLDNGNELERNFQNFTILKDLPIPCKNHFHLDTEWFAHQKWTLFEVCDGHSINEIML